MRIVLLCTGNSARSQMAEGWARALAPADFEIHSAGTHPVGVHALAVEAMAERGVDIGAQRSKGLDDIPSTADVMVTLCSSAAGECPTYPGAARVEHWDLPDPAAAKGSDDERRAAFRQVRDDLERRLRALLAELAPGRVAKG